MSLLPQLLTMNTIITVDRRFGMPGFMEDTGPAEHYINYKI